jgi:hypothetical protein
MTTTKINNIDTYDDYISGVEVARILTKKITQYYKDRGYTIYTVYISYEQLDRKYFVNTEVGGDEKRYHYNRGLFTLDEILRAYKITI